MEDRDAINAIGWDTSLQPAETMAVTQTPTDAANSPRCRPVYHRGTSLQEAQHPDRPCCNSWKRDGNNSGYRGRTKHSTERHFRQNPTNGTTELDVEIGEFHTHSYWGCNFCLKVEP
ncbi:hypothetical protein JTB14_037559 [Gonioctena quinquepunctata]|nr:hypothetical protein JTB14_037559 [Gonioctena quinquepunctata]